MIKSSGSSWETTSYKTDPLRDTLVERARKRTVTPKTDRNWWTVTGHVFLGDSYDFYDVHLRPDGSYGCSCQGSRGGEYRKHACSHRTAVILYRQDHEDPWTDIEIDTDHEDVGGDESSVRGSAEEASPPATLSDGVDIPVSRPSPEEDERRSSMLSELAEGEDGDLVGQRRIADSPSGPNNEYDPHDHDHDHDSHDYDPFDLDWDDPPTPQSIAAFSGVEHPLPAKFSEFRLDQWRGIIEVVEALDDPAIKCVFLSAPTGSGKSLLAATVPQIKGSAFIYTCTTHTLQEQVRREFTYAKVLKGRRNYLTFDNPDDPELTADDCTRQRAKLPACPLCPGWQKGSTFQTYVDDESMRLEGDHCSNCHPVRNCPYLVAKTEAQYARMAVLNTSYFLSETNYTFKSVFRHWDLVFIDEADMIENELMGFITVEITPSIRKDLNIGLPDRKTVEESWVNWIRDEVIPAIKAKLKDLPRATTDLFGKPDVKILRARKKYDRLLRQVEFLLKPPPPPPGEERDSDDDTPALMSGWVMTGYEKVDGEDKKDHNVSVTFKPITVRDYARDVLWNNASQFVLMSATIISPEQMAYDLGLEDGEWAVVEIPSSFAKERRPVIVRAETSVTRKTEQTAYPILINQLLDIMEDHPDERILVHSNSYKLTRELFFETRKKSSMARDRVISYFYAHEREKALNRYLASEDGVLIAPSFQRGVDLHGDDCRVIVIAKCPFPYLGDKQISARLYSTGRAGKTWYSVETIRTICQMTGRGMRSKDDWVISYILDKEFLRVYWENPKLFPAWWREAVVFDENDPRWRAAIEDLRGVAV